MRVTITVECDNEAFIPAPKRELARILRDLTARLGPHAGPQNGLVDFDELKLHDINGNTVGKVTVQA